MNWRLWRPAVEVWTLGPRLRALRLTADEASSKPPRAATRRTTLDLTRRCTCTGEQAQYQHSGCCFGCSVSRPPSSDQPALWVEQGSRLARRPPVLRQRQQDVCLAQTPVTLTPPRANLQTANGGAGWRTAGRPRSRRPRVLSARGNPGRARPGRGRLAAQGRGGECNLEERESCAPRVWMACNRW